MNRRGFLKSLSAVPFIAAIPLLARQDETLEQFSEKYIKPAMEVATDHDHLVSGNRLMTPDEITREALNILNDKMSSFGTMDYAKPIINAKDTLKIRMPNRYKLA